jgi:hypothetical protein
MLTYANMDMKKTFQGYGAKLCLRLVSNRLKEMKGLFFHISFWGFSSRKHPRRFLCVHQVKKLLENFLNENQL